MIEHKRLHNMEATILWKDLPIVDFKIERDKVFYVTPHYENERYFPIEFRNAQGISMDEINMFCDARIVPRERFNIQDLLQAMGISEYRWEPIIRHVHGLCTDDCYWFRFPEETFTYDDVKIRD